MKITASKLQTLKDKGYKGEDTLEALVKELAVKMPKSKNGFDWWYDFRDAEYKKGIEFEDALVTEVEKDLKKEVKRG